MTQQNQQFGFDLSEDDAVMIEALVNSPIFSALKRCLEHYRKECLSALATSTDTTKIFQTQGRIIGIGVVENLPVLLNNRRIARLENEKKKNEINARTRRPPKST